MNDEDFARTFFARAIEQNTEPSSLPSLDRIAARGRQNARARSGLYAAGTVALAGAVTAGIAAAPGLLGSGGGPQVSSAAGGNSSAPVKTPASPGPNPPAGSTPTLCATPPAVNLTAIIGSTLPPGTTATINPKAASNGVLCLQGSDGSMEIEALYTLANPGGILEIDVTTGDGRLKGAVAPNTAKPGGAIAAGTNPKAELSKLAMAQDTGNAKADPTAFTTPPTPSAPTCSTPAPGDRVCATDIAKGGYVGIDVELTRTTPTPLVVNVLGSTGSPTGAAGEPPLSAEQLTAIANAVAAAF